ncbi:metallophosphoesterase family protein [Methylobacterium sp. Leaf85]|uniref:metallophosphoesterase family protein n=1 Tax=Methylobacterium sp. Leaf85 TaxID=1736241 RepID=UPI001FCCF02E|nr:metallophosphoesterase [Methylobacterium sp. Leaf85]
MLDERRGGSAGGAGTPESLVDTSRTVRRCADLAYRLMKALVEGDGAEAARIEGEITAGPCDPNWARTIREYVAFFGVAGARGEIPYVRPTAAGESVVPIRTAARIALVADWGTGAEPAKRVLTAIADMRPDVVVHLGDIYYSGTPVECRENFIRPIEAALGANRERIPVFALAGNHDMYCGGVGYYPMIAALNPGTLRQAASYFCLRSMDSSWQILAMDTGLNDYNPVRVSDALTYVEPDERAWHLRRIREFGGRTILLSHHQLFSAFARIGSSGTSACNPHLLAMLAEFQVAGPIAAWFWGHEHSLDIYRPFAGLGRGRCIGHGAVPVFAEEGGRKPLEGLVDAPQLVPGTEPSVERGIYAHGFAMLTLGTSDMASHAEYFEVLEGTTRSVYAETIA